MEKKFDCEKKETVYDKVSITVGMLNVVITAGLLLIAALVAVSIWK